LITISRLAGRFNLSRSTLLYYDSIGLLKPSGRSGSGYRLYSRADQERLERIVTFRRTGLPLKEIARVLDSPAGRLSEVLTGRLRELSREIDRLRGQQRLIVGLLRRPELLEEAGVMTRRTWTDLLTASGFSEEDMVRWHVDFERLHPDKHLRFLRFLSIPEDQIRVIRDWASEGEVGS